jgi:hypothetical protein
MFHGLDVEVLRLQEEFVGSGFRYNDFVHGGIGGHGDQTPAQAPKTKQPAGVYAGSTGLEPQKCLWSPKIPMKVERREISKLVTTYRRHSL